MHQNELSSYKWRLNKMKNKIILIATTLVILLAVTMPAMGEVVYLTNSNKFPDGEFNVSVSLNGTEKNISVELLEYPANITPLSFEKFTYNLSTTVATVSEGNLLWDKNVGQPNADGFGNFLSNKVKVNCGSVCHAQSGISYGYGIPGPLVFNLEEEFNPASLEPNSDQNASLAVHLIFRLNEGNCTFCTWISDGVSRCNHVLGHVVNAGADQMVDEGDLLTIDLTFKDGFTKGHDGHTGGCSDEEDGGCMGGGSGDSHESSGDTDEGSMGGSGGSQGIKHGQCELHDHTAIIDWGDGIEETIDPAVSPFDITHTYEDIGIYTVKVTIVDDYGRVGTDSMQVTVVSIDTPIDPVLINTAITASATIPDGMLPESLEWDWGDGNKNSVDIQDNSVTSNHTYSSTGIYMVTLEVTYNKGMETVNMTAQSADYVVVYDPDGGFVAGGGWIDSPLGAYMDDPNLAGKANFGFISNYQKGASVPNGNTEFQFKMADLNFHSDNYQWLVIAGPHAKYKGSGTINGIGDYGFMLTATDSNINGVGDSDAFRIKIWDMDESIVYDNEPSSDDDANANTSISGGSIQIYI
jgi:PKD repeat protein/uncharacterized membrane protein YgcG